ncbi:MULTISPECIES: shikimate dehydrogenase [Methylobacterium]|uniref:Shikimate dehydrogenase (NADP(+)) n=1 Tax=Methylobacterium phyllosphaerae TaxID=418223 RepID=A0AAE8HX25_9HYPH|nr:MULTISPECIES: shikimate dehydrogenase [Methylobacterium]KOX41823.1 shikimate dehydrogenase [Streptomyces purpurogeneiscleroticus]APT33081.1 shikimate dehydrogenase (NADP(+)) [Methylobacterium phyllosphaerae]MDE4911113.1 shikimate dehydrogenase [Methylobacterium sp. 092160098-2]RUP13016.1 MAG: shikimate dehydrogenase [Methylobacterium sp.]WFS06582.1 shikimate dehydrogenase [Methylobacterium sp. 391_Methyba4]
MSVANPRAFVVGHPIAHSRSPLIHGYWLAAHGIPGSYERLDVPPAAFPDFIRALPDSGFRGGNVTIPHKEAAFALADTLTPRAKAIGAVNTLVVEPDGRIRGDNTDAPGFCAHLDHTLGAAWPARAGGTALVLGAGGAARAIVVGLAERGLRRIWVANRTAARAEAVAALAPGIGAALAWDDLPAALAGTGLLVNTTSLGMKGQPPLAIDLSPLPAEAAVADIVYAPLETELLAAARRRGLAAVDGLGMLLHQAVPGFEAWFGPRPAVTPALRDRIVADLAG